MHVQKLSSPLPISHRIPLTLSHYCAGSCVKLACQICQATPVCAYNSKLSPLSILAVFDSGFLLSCFLCGLSSAPSLPLSVSFFLSSSVSFVVLLLVLTALTCWLISHFIIRAYKITASRHAVCVFVPVLLSSSPPSPTPTPPSLHFTVQPTNIILISITIRFPHDGCCHRNNL